MLQSPYKVYCKWCAIKAHLYTKAYNILVYGKRTNASEASFEKRPDRPAFYAMANSIDWKEIDHWLVANLEYRDNPSAFDLVKDLQLSRKVYDRWTKNISYIKENYAEDLRTIAKAANWQWSNVASIKETEYPLPFRLMMAQKITIESWCLLDDLLKLSDKWNERFLDGMHLSLTAKHHKYRMLLNVSVEETAAMTPRNLESLDGAASVKLC
jgi:hypothetical protein